MKAFQTRLVGLLGVLVCAGLFPSASSFPGLRGIPGLPVRSVVTADHNGDGRPDVWRTYDRRGLLVEEALDTNFDGRSDVREYFDRGILVRRESDRNFDDRIDLVEEFDRTTQLRSRSVTDTDFDGTADRLVLFSRGRPVFSKTLDQVAHRTHKRLASVAFHRSGDDPIALFADPFSLDLRLQSGAPASGQALDAWMAESPFVWSTFASVDAHITVTRHAPIVEFVRADRDIDTLPSRGPPAPKVSAL